jgi:hypothetical protein
MKYVWYQHNTKSKTERGMVNAVCAKQATVTDASWWSPWQGTCCVIVGSCAVPEWESCVSRLQGIGCGSAAWEAASGAATACDGHRKGAAGCENGVAVCQGLPYEGKQEESALCLRQSVA